MNLKEFKNSSNDGFVKLYTLKSFNFIIFTLFFKKNKNIFQSRFWLLSLMKIKVFHYFRRRNSIYNSFFYYAFHSIVDSLNILKNFDILW